MSTATQETQGATADLLALAERVAGWAGTGEEVEVYVARGTETEVRAYDGEVESLTSATSAGIGVRVIVDHRLGFAWAGSLDESVLGETLEEARDNARFATPDEHVRLAVPDGVEAVPVDLWDEGLAGVPTERKVALALDLEARARAADPRIRQVSSADYGDGASEIGAGVDHRDPFGIPQDVRLPVGERHRRRGGRQSDRRRLQRRTRRRRTRSGPRLSRTR